MNSEEVIEKLSDEVSLEEKQEKLLLKVKSSMKRLHAIWNELGIDGAQKLQRVEVVCMHVENLYQEMIDEETALCEDIKKRIQNYREKVLELSNLLNIPVTEELDESLIQKEENLREEFNNLSKLKSDRMKTYEDLRTVEVKYCKTLCLSPLNFTSDVIIPSEENLYELQQHIAMLKLEKNKRFKKLYTIKKELTTILETTELVPETSLEKNIISANEDNITLSNEILDAMDEAICKARCKKAELESLQNVLLDKLANLWHRLGVNDTEKLSLFSKHSNARISTIEAIKKELEKCEEIKNQNKQNYIESIRKELKTLWDKCFISETQRQSFLFNLNEYDEDILEAYDNEAEKWRSYHKRTEQIINKINKRQQLWELMITFENKASDPSRYKNRRGNLLQEERERKKVQKNLPTLENEIITDINNYESLTGELFLYFGEDFRCFVNKQWENRIIQKENEKAMRQSHLKQLDNKMTSTPKQKKIFCSITPKSAPSKLFRPRGGVPIYCSPTAGISKKVTNTIEKLKVKKSRHSSSKKYKNDISENMPKLEYSEEISSEKVEEIKLTEENQGIVNLSDETTFTNFAAELNKTSRKCHRSSILYSRKIVGTRISRKNCSHDKKKM
ncbi:protein regulator of cytokinesis 1-like [Stegodyphus dumicola]|uniref:protein regulator of cytokinesis 1-like n=1 Tax=Stegodyphus dumicola TaxID=202533 RepID=UPI0015AC19B2|nr:protein regulator of cytokinesis 1-like [Stegodyphus dumicola]